MKVCLRALVKSRRSGQSGLIEMDTGFQPLDPSDHKNKEKTRRRKRHIPYRVIMPNLVTLLGLCAGLTAIRMAIEGRMELAVILIVIAAALDGVDGRVARFLKGSSKFGAELDSLTDFVNFGVAPAIMLFMWGLQDYRSIGWISCLIFAICAVLRLARFNAALDNPNKPVWHSRFFVGIPAPAGAITALLPIYGSFLGIPANDYTQTFVIAYVLSIGFLMVSSLPTFSGKTFGRSVAVEWVVPIIILIVFLVALLVTYTWWFLTIGTILYLGAIPFSWRSYKRLERLRG